VTPKSEDFSDSGGQKVSDFSDSGGQKVKIPGVKKLRIRGQKVENPEVKK